MSKIFILLSLTIVIVIQAQNVCNYSLSGKIKDIHSGETIENAEVLVCNTMGQKIYSTFTNEKGEYLISNVCAETYNVIISHLGYVSKTFPLSINKNIIKNYSLEHHEKEIQEVITISKSQKNTKTSIENKISKSQINSYSDTNLGMALTSIAGVNSLSTGNNIVKPVIHGLHSSRVPILNDGIRQEDQQWGIEHAPDIDVNLANSIFIIKSAGALQYAGDAIGGIILVEPKKLTRQDTLLGNILTSNISNGKGGNLSANIEKGFGNGLAFRVQGTYKKLGDLSAPNYNLSNTGILENDYSVQAAFNKNSFGMEIFYSYYGTDTGILKSAHIGNLENLVNAINSKQPLIIEDFTMDIDAPKQKIQHNLAKINTFYNFNLGKLSFTYGYQFNNRKEYDIRRSAFKGKPSLNLDLTTQDFHLDFDHKKIFGFKGKMGVSYIFQKNIPNVDTGISPIIPYYEKNNFGTYWIENYSLTPNLILETGFRYDYQKIDALKFFKKTRWQDLGYDKKYPNLVLKDTGLSYLTNPVLEFYGFAATLGANYKIGASNDIIVNYSLSSRMPNPSELFSDGLHHSAAAIELGDLDLKNEKSNKVMATFRGNLLNYRINLEITTHYNYIKDYINQIPTGVEYSIRGAFPVWKYIQTHAEIYGIDVMADFNINPNIKIETNFSYLRGNDKKNDIALINMPPAKWVNSLLYENKKWMNFFTKLSSISVFRQNHYPDYNFTVNIVNNGIITPTLLDISTPPAAYQIFDFNTGFSLPITYHNKLNISFTIRNIFDTSYRDYLNRLRFYSDEVGRNLILNLQYNF